MGGVIIIPVLTIIVFVLVTYHSIRFFTEGESNCPNVDSCEIAKHYKCREGDKALVACVAAVSFLFMLAQILDWAVKGINPEHETYLHVWHGYNLFSAITWLFIIHHLRARMGWRKHR